MNKNNLVGLVYGIDPNFVELKNIYALEREGLKIDIEKQTWSYNYKKDVKFGENSRCISGSKNIIGIYDREDLTHLREMMQTYKSLSAKLSE